MRGRSQIPVHGLYDSRTSVIITNSVPSFFIPRYTLSLYPWISIDLRLYIRLYIRLKRTFLDSLFFFFFSYDSRQNENFEREGKKEWFEWSTSGVFRKFFEKQNICVDTLKRLFLPLLLLRRYTEYVLKALEDRRKPVSEISRVMILACAYNVVVWIYYISWKITREGANNKKKPICRENWLYYLLYAYLFIPSIHHAVLLVFLPRQMYANLL